LVKLAADFADQVQPLRGEQDRPFRAFAIQFKQSHAVLAMVGHEVYDLVERDLADGLAASPDDRSASRVDDSCEARPGLRKRPIAIEEQLVGIPVGPPRGAHDESYVAALDVRF